MHMHMYMYAAWSASGARPWMPDQASTPHSLLPSHFLLPTSYFLRITSYFLRSTSHFLRITSYFLRITSYCVGVAARICTRGIAQRRL